jgi:hypothetical protein
MVINASKKYCYRITHRENLVHLLTNGLVNKSHIKASPDFLPIGNLEIIDVRGSTEVKILGYGYIGDYIPFYFTSRSIMLFNILTGYYAPKVSARTKDELIVIRCLVSELAKLPRWFFTDGQANDGETIHYNDLDAINMIDWDCIHQSNFKKSDGDYDRPRRYQAEFLVHNEVPIEYIDSICVYNDTMKTWAEEEIKNKGFKIPVVTQKAYFFD